MNLKKLIFILLFFTIISFSINSVNASELSNDSLEVIDDTVEIMNDDNVENVLTVSDDLLLGNDEEELDDDSYVIYVGHNNKTETGNGSYENPFSTLELACNNVTNQDKVTVKIFSGTYLLGSVLNFTTNNLYVVGINGSVVIKNKYNEDSDGFNNRSQSFSLSSSSANFTFSNLIFDFSDYSSGFEYDDYYHKKSNTWYHYRTWFLPFYGHANLGIFYNCSFIGLGNNNYLAASGYNSRFIKCYFSGINNPTTKLYADGKVVLTNTRTDFIPSKVDVCIPTFEYCVLDLPNLNYLANINTPCNMSMDSMWFGDNDLPSYVTSPGANSAITGYNDNTYKIPVSRYAQFSVSQNYLGNNQYEIVGKLTWNGTDDQDGMENFQLMTVTLSSTSGELNDTAPVLANGNFRLTYTSSNANNKIHYTLDQVDEDLEFAVVNITAVAPAIKYGQDQNVTINFSQAITGNVNVTVSNGSYRKEYVVSVDGKDSINYTIPDTLKAGSYLVDVSLSDVYVGFNSTELVVSKWDVYTFDAIIPGSGKVGETLTIEVTLPDDVNGTVVVKVGSESKVVDAKSSLTVDFTDLNATDYDVNVTYNGNDKYESKSITDSVSISKGESTVTAENQVFIYNQSISIPYATTNANGVKVKVLKDGEEKAVNINIESSEILIDTLDAGNYTVEITTIVDTNYNENSTEINLTIKKASSSIEVDDSYEFEYGSNSVISAVTVNSTGDVIVTLADANNKEFTASVSGDTITLPVLPVGAYTLNVTTNVDGNHNNATDSAKITIIQTTPKVEVLIDPADDIKVTDEVTITVKLPSDATGLVLLEVGDMKLFDELNDEGFVEFIVNDLSVKTYDITAKYVGDKNYTEAVNDTESFTVTEIAQSNVNVTVDDKNSTADIGLPENASGNVVIKVDGREIYNGAADQTPTIDLNSYAPGNHIIEIAYSGDKNYASDITTKEFTVPKAETSISANPIVFEEGNSSNIEVDIPGVDSGVILVDVGDKKFYGDISAGKATVLISGLVAGNYTAKITFAGDEKFNATSGSVTVNVTEGSDLISELKEIIEGKDAEITELNNNLTEKDNIISGKDAEISALNDTVAEKDGVIAGKDAEISALNDTVNAQNGTISNQSEQISALNDTVNAQSGVIDSQADEISALNDTVAEKDGVIAGKDAEISALNDTVNAQNGTISNQSEQISALNDTVNAQSGVIDSQADEISALNSTVAEKDGVIAGKDAEISALNDTVNVQSGVIDSQAGEISDLNDTVNALRDIIDSLKDQNVTVVVDGQEYTVEVVNGTATIETNKTEIKKASEFSEITIGDNQTISLVLKDEDGNVIANAPITYAVNGAVNTTTTDKDGKFTIQGEDGALITIAYAGDANITGTNTTLKLNGQVVPEVVKVATHFNISDRAITIKGYAVDGPAGEQGIYYATTVLDENDKPISNVYIEFAVNNKIYNRTTDENGSFVPYKLNMVRAGRYTMAFNYAGNDNYTNAFACVCVDLDKKPITIKAPAKTYKAAAKTKKYTVTLSTIPSVHDGKVYLSPKKVTLKVNGKTYTGKTNNNGQVTFKITNLNKKGKYTAKISYEGDKTYESATQKVKLNIK